MQILFIRDADALIHGKDSFRIKRAALHNNGESTKEGPFRDGQPLSLSQLALAAALLTSDNRKAKGTWGERF